MATYFHGNSEIQGDGLQTLILMNPSYVGYSDTQQQQAPPQSGNFVFLNSAGNSISHQTQQFVGIPLQSPATSQDPNPQAIHGHHEMSALHGYIPRVSYNLWNSIDTRDTPRGTQGLSLSLSSQHPAYASSTAISPAGGGGGGDDLRVSGASSSSASGISNGGVSGMQSVLLSSKYLKAAQELLDEVVNVNSGLKTERPRGSNGLNKIAGESSPDAGESSMAVETNTKRGAELTTGERQEIQMKKAKLVSMLDEVEQRYRQYHHQMHIVITSFEQAAGIGSANTYTALALQTISKQFRCLKDAISGQIRAASRSLGEEDGSSGKEGSRLKFVDHQIRQQRALQQLGMIQHNAWRPQRGLPERSVSVLRAWLFEHFLHPYPKDSDKHMLAKKTGLTRSQVSNWFINARVRLWKPMVEEMYMEEVKEHEQNRSDDKTSKVERDEDSGSQEKSLNTSKQDNPKTQSSHSSIPISTTSTSPIGGNLRNPPSFTLIGSPVIDGYGENSPKKPRNTNVSPSRVINPDVKPHGTNNEEGFMKFGDERQSRDGYSIMTGPTNFISGFGSYPMGEMGRFDTEQFTPRFSGNAVSLTLGLPHCENLSLSAAHQTFLPNQTIQLGRGIEIGEANEFVAMNTPTSTHSTPVYDAINIQNRKRFAAQLLPDFVA